MIRFSVFLPVRNGWPYVKECVESILNQSYPHFELVVMDNCSIDNTVQWITSLKDDRIRLIKSQESLSIQESWARIKTESKFEYMTMIGHDDTYDKNFLEIIKDLTLKYPDATLYQTGARLINSKGTIIRNCSFVPESETADQYLRDRFTFKRDVFGTGYVMRSADYDQIGGIFNFERLFFADDALWLSLMKKAWKAADPRLAFSVRIHPNSESASLPSAWLSILLGLNQLNQFLKEFIKEDKLCEKVYNELSDSFFLKYHRNIYIYALVGASKNGKRIEEATIERIESSLISGHPALTGQLRKSLKIRAIEFLNLTFLRGLVILLWKTYRFIKTKTN